MSSRVPASSSRHHQQQNDDDDDDRLRHSNQDSEQDSDDDQNNQDDDDDHQTGGTSTRRRNRKKGKGKDQDEKKTEITVERTVIHEALIRRAIHKELKTYYDPAVVPLESELELDTVDKLVLSYCNIYAIDNLQGFEKLTELRLDNNIIEKIENLDHLLNLRWLDLSFNKITKIQGLEKLIHLTDLSLFDNEISVIEGLENLTKLNVLSVGNNQIKDLSFIQGLRKFKNLRLLNLKGNPVCNHDDYHNTIFAYLTNLKYLDYVVIEQSQFAKARDSKLDQLLILEAKEKSEDLLEKEKKLSQEQQLILDQANLGGLSTLFVDMIKADSEYPKIKVLPGFDVIQQQYKQAFQAIIDEFSQEILTRHQLKLQEKKILDEVLDKIHTTAEVESKAEIDRYTHLKKKAFKSYTESLDKGSVDTFILPSLKSELGEVTNQLMDIEMLLVEQIESIFEEFEKTYLKLISENVLKINACFRSLIDGSNKHTSNVYDLTHSLLEKFTKDDSFTDDVDVKAILQDKDILNNAVSTSHENQEGKIAAKEDEIREREEGNGKKLIKDLRDQHRTRNRKRVAEIHEFKAREEANIAEEEEQQEDDEDS